MNMSPMPQRLYLMQVVKSGETPAGMGGVACYLIEMGDGRRVLVDTGLPANFQMPAGTPAPVYEMSVVEQLAVLGLRPENIDLLICTHFDIDHAGHHDAFPNAEFIVQREHYELAKAGNPRFDYAPAHWDHPALCYRLVDGDCELLPGLTLLKTSGHAPGHQSVLVRLPETGPVLLAIDAVALERLFTPARNAWPLDDDEAQLRTSTQKLLDVVEREGVRLVVFGHDAHQWAALKLAPAFYG